MNKKKSLVYSVLLILVLGLVITTGTFAYLQWQAATGTQVNVTIEHGGITMHIEPEETEFVGLYPVHDCTKNSRYGDVLVTIVNNTGTLAIPSFKLKARVVGTPDNDNFDYSSHIHYTVVALGESYVGTEVPEKGMPLGGNYYDGFTEGECDKALNVSSLKEDDEYLIGDNFFNNYIVFGRSATSSFNTNVSTTNLKLSNSWQDFTPYDSDFLPRHYNVDSGKVSGVTFRGEPYSTTKQWFRVYVWIDEGYTTTIIGNDTSTDPLQNLKIEVTWSENSTVQQVSGETILEDDLEITLDPGLYAAFSSPSIYSWDELLGRNDIVVDDSSIIAVSSYLTGILVIPEGILGIQANAFENSGIGYIVMPDSVAYIGVSAFSASSISEIILGENSSLYWIDENAFEDSWLTKIKFPGHAIVSANAFNSASLNEIVFSSNIDARVSIDNYAFSNNYLTSVEFPAGVTDIGVEAFANNTDLSRISFAPYSKLESIDHFAFAYTSITRITIPKSVTYIGEGIFYNCDKLETIMFDGTVSEWNAIEKEDGSKDLYGGEAWNASIPATEVICSDGRVSLVD